MAEPWKKYQPEGPWQRHAGAPKGVKAPQGRGGFGDTFKAADPGKGIPGVDEAAAALYALPGAAIDAVKGRGFNPGAAYDRMLNTQVEQKAYDRQNSPVASAVGEIAGGVGTSLALPFGKAATLGKGLTNSALYGLLYGASENKDDRLMGGVKGAASAVTGDLIGRGVLKGVGRVMSPKPSDAARLLMDEGVALTPGQRLGGVAKRVEDTLSSVPVLGAGINSARSRGLTQFNRAAVNRALKPLGKTAPLDVKGADLMRFGQQAFDEAYTKARAGMVLQADDALGEGIAALRGKAATGELSDAAASRLNKIIDSQVERRLIAGNGVMDGSTLKTVISDLKKQQSKLIAGVATGEERELGDAIGELVNHLDEAARRNPASDKAAIALMDKADEGYAQFVRVESAAKMRGGEPGTFSASQFDSAVQRSDKTARNRAYLRGDALMQDLANAGNDLLPNKMPNSGTTDRALLAALAAGSPVGGAPGMLAAGAATLPYLPGIDQATLALLTKRPGAMRKLGDILPKYAAPAGLLGSVFAAQGGQ